MRALRRLLLLALPLVACAPGASPSPTLDHPSQLVGRWVRLREDSTWGDTLVYLADGRVLGSTGHAVPPSARWGIKAGAGGIRQFCAADAKEGYCQTFQLQDSALILDGGPAGPTIFRRAP